MKSVQENLFTPRIQHDPDPLFNGENWFFYWKTAPSLWESKLSQFKGHTPILIPINWAFHAQKQEYTQEQLIKYQRQGVKMNSKVQYEFGKKNPHCALSEIDRIAQKLDLEILFCFQITPLPFLPNGGVPSWLARVPLQDSRGLDIHTMDQDQKIHKLYTFFDQRVFIEYQRFLSAIHEHFTTTGVRSQTIAIESGYTDDAGNFKSYFEDASSIYQYNLKNYLSSFGESLTAKDDFYQSVYGLYRDVLEESLGGSWAGVKQVAFIGSSPSQTQERIFSGKINVKRMLPMTLKSISQEKLWSYALYPHHELSPLLRRVHQKHFNQKNFLKHFREEMLEKSDVSFDSLNVFTFFTKTNLADSFFENLGLTDLLNVVNPYGVAQHQNFEPYYHNTISGIHFILGNQLHPDEMSQVIKMFLSGSSLVLDTEEMGQDLLKKLDWFILENQLKRHKLFLGIEFEMIELNDCKFIIFNKKELSKVSASQKQDFWERVLHFFEFQYLRVKAQEGIEYFWMLRNSGIDDIRYHDVRRICLYNPTNYSLKLAINPNKQFALLKVVDENSVHVQSSMSGVEVVVSPQGSVSLDFGRYHQ